MECNEPTSLEARLTVPVRRRGGRLVTVKAGQLVLAEQASPLAGGERRLRLAVPRRLRPALGRRFAATLTVVARDQFGNRGAVTRVVRVSRMRLRAALCACVALMLVPAAAEAAGTVTVAGTAVDFQAAAGVANDVLVIATPGASPYTASADVINEAVTDCEGNGTNTVTPALRPGFTQAGVTLRRHERPAAG